MIAEGWWMYNESVRQNKHGQKFNDANLYQRELIP